MHEKFLEAARLAPLAPHGSFLPEVAEILGLVGDGIVCVDAQGRITLFNRAAEELFGYQSVELIGCAIDVLIPERFRYHHRMDVDAFVGLVAPTSRSMGSGREVVGRHRDGHEFFIEATLSSHVLAGQRTFTAVVRDVSDRQSADEKRRLVAEEVAHRLRNTMAVITSIMSMTARSATSLPEFIKTLVGRFTAISRMNDVLIGGASIDTDFRTLLLSELAVFQDQDRRIELHGSDLKIEGKLALDLALLIHELATNAVKYGALSMVDGGVRVDWHVSADDVPALELVWQENGGPAVTKPEKIGFGSQLIAGILSSHAGTAKLAYDPAGVCCTLSVPLK